MKTYYSSDYSLSSSSVVALGCFDGVHIAHARVIAEARRKANDLGAQCVVWTFNEPPKNYFLSTPVPLLTDRHQKESVMEALGVDVLISLPFDRSICEISAEDFFEQIIVKKLNATHIVCGYDYIFGSKGRGNTALLKELCDTRSIGLTVISNITKDGISVSSSAIRELLLDGQPEKAASLLGRPYSLSSKVIDGQHLARSLGFPTLNQTIPSGMLIPKFGVYVSEIIIENSDQKLYGITNVGIRPTVGGSTPFVETHIFDFSGNLYGLRVNIGFLKFLREERKFENLEDLTHQVNTDIASAKKFIQII